MNYTDNLVNRWKVACDIGNPQEKYRVATLLCELEEKNRKKMRFSSEEQMVFQEARFFLGK